MRRLLHVVSQTLIALDQFLNCALSLLSPWAWGGAWADETLSCRAYRSWRDGRPFGRLLMPAIDLLFRWQTLPAGAIGHCHGAYLKERTRYNMPPELREGSDAHASR